MANYSPHIFLNPNTGDAGCSVLALNKNKKDTQKFQPLDVIPMVRFEVGKHWAKGELGTIELALKLTPFFGRDPKLPFTLKLKSFSF